MSTAGVPTSEYGSIYGSLYFGCIIATASYGFTCMQTFFYYVHYQDDHWRMKCFVALLWALNTIHEALTVAGAYKYIMSGLQNPSSIFFAPPELPPQLLLTALVAVPTQGFFVHRLYLFSGRYIIIPLIWVILAIVEIVFSTIYVADALTSAYTPQGVSAVDLSDSFFTDVGTVSLSVAAGVDVLIAIFLTTLLLRKRFATPIASTATILQRLTVFAVNTGIWPATFAILTVTLMQVYRSNVLYAVFGDPLCSIYCNTLLANLNARLYVRGEAIEHHIDVDLFTTASLPDSDTNKRHKELQITPARQAWTEALGLPAADQSLARGSSSV